jgi:hypothetical protein
MEDHMTGRKLRNFKNANIRIPESITSQLIEKIDALSGGPKTDYLKSVYLEKFVSKDTAPSTLRRQRAISKWLATERGNEATNVRLLITHEEYNILPRVTFGSFVAKARSIIEQVIGAVPSFDSLIGEFSGGATTSRKRTESHPASKYLGQADITPDALPVFLELLEEMPGWTSFGDLIRLNEVPGNVLFTVPKNAEVDRVACKEPDINMFMQKGLGSTIRSKLKRVGIDLNDQSRNRDLARIGSTDGSLATLDLSSASDSVSYGLVELLMPFNWFTLLTSLRSPITLIDGVEHRNEMFSSMGNGFTFELESLIFYALARTTAYFSGIPGIISVYGDDIIVPTDLALDLIWVLEYFGFQVNTKKSFYKGSFRESCGGHFINGCDVTPFYLRKPIDRLTDLIHVANAIRKWGTTSIGIIDPELWPIWSWLRDMIPKSLWVGHELSSITQLVSPHRARSRLSPLVTSKDSGDGGYIHWLNTTWKRRRLNDAIETSSVSNVTHIYRRAPAGAELRTWDLFLEEIFGAE